MENKIPTPSWQNVRYVREIRGDVGCALFRVMMTTEYDDADASHILFAFFLEKLLTPPFPRPWH